MCFIFHTKNTVGLIVLLVLKLNYAHALYCYSCGYEQENWKCNEAEPKSCKKNEVCVTMKIRGVSKSCMDGCLTSRGDGDSAPCRECNESLCNEPFPDTSIRPEKDRRYSATDENGVKYTLHVKLSTFWRARMRCAAGGGVLATIHSTETQKFIQNNFVVNSKVSSIMEMVPGELGDNPTLKGNGFWVGLQRFASDKYGTLWMWTDDGSVIDIESNKCEISNITLRQYSNWDHTQPVELQKESQLCGSVSRSRDGKWKGLSCGKILPAYLCQFPNNPVQQSTIRNTTVFTYMRSQEYNTKIPQNCESVKRDLNEKDLFGYMNDQTNTAGHNCIQQAEEKVPGRPHCEKSMICNRLVFVNCSDESKLVQNISSVENFSNMTSTSFTPSSIMTSVQRKKFCESNVKRDKSEVLSFPQTSARRFAYSSEKCTDGRPKAMFFCGTKPDVRFKNFAKLDCERNMSDTWNKNFVGAENYTMQDLHEAVLFNDHLMSPNVSNLMSIVSAISRKNNQITTTDFRNVFAVAGKLHKILLRHKINQTFDALPRRKKSSLVSVLEKYAQRVILESNETRTSFFADGIEVEVVKLDASTPYSNEDEALHYEHISANQDSVISVTPPRTRSRKDLRAIFMSYDDSELFPTDEDVQVDSVVSATITDGNKTYSVPVEFSMRISPDINVSSEMCIKKECRYYDHLENMWKTNGCRIESERGDVVKCTCDHTTSFAVVVSQHVLPSYALDVVSTIGLVLCIVCLMLTIFIFILTPELRRVRSSVTHINLFLCLAIAYLVFVIGIEMTENRYVCVSIAALIHFFLISAWGWMAIESLTMYRMFVRAFDRRNNNEDSKKIFLVYAVAFVIVLVTISFSILSYYQGWDTGSGCQNDAWSNYVAENYCWLQGNSLYFGFLLIVGLALAFNICLAAAIIKAITWGRKSVQSSVDEKPAIHVLRAVLVALLLGITWIFAIPLVISDDPTVQTVFGWLFALTTFAQGFFIFYFFCLRRKDVRDSWTNAVIRVFRPKKRDNDHIVMMNNVATSQLPSAEPRSKYQNSASDATARTAVSCSASFRSYGKSPKINSSKPAYKPDEIDDTKSMDRSIDMVDFSGEEVFEH